MKSIIEVLPNEVTGSILDCLLPHQQVGWALASKLALTLSNQSVASLVPPHAQVTQSRALEWTRQFNELPLEMQNALETTAGLLPCPDIFIPFDEVQLVHLELERARQHIAQGDESTGLIDLMVAENRAQKAGIQMPIAKIKQRIGLSESTVPVLRRAV